MNPETIKSSIQAVIDGIAPLAQKLGVALESFWGWAIKHNYAIAYENVMFAIVGLIALVVGVYLLRRASKLKKEDRYDEPVGHYIVGISLIFGGVILFLGCSQSAIDRLIAPEWNTAQDISNLIHGNQSR